MQEWGREVRAAYFGNGHSPKCLRAKERLGPTPWRSGLWKGDPRRAKDHHQLLAPGAGVMDSEPVVPFSGES